jgi:outer membrane protein FlgP
LDYKDYAVTVESIIVGNKEMKCLFHDLRVLRRWQRLATCLVCLILKDIAMKHLSIVSAAAALTLLSACSSMQLFKTAQVQAPAPNPNVSLLAPMVEKRENFVATGYAVISIQNHKNPAQQRLLAIRASKLDAYRALTEQVYGQHLDANTTVSDMTVVNDTFRTKVEGVIYGAQLVSIAPVSDDTYETTLSLDRAVVQDLRNLYLQQLAMRTR